MSAIETSDTIILEIEEDLEEENLSDRTSGNTVPGEQISTKLCSEKKTTLKCGICVKQFSSKSTLRRHVRECHFQYNNYTCAICNKGFPRLYNAERHKRQHCKEFSKPLGEFACAICKKQFASKLKLESHLLTHDCSNYFEPLEKEQPLQEDNVVNKESCQVSKTTCSPKISNGLKPADQFYEDDENHIKCKIVTDENLFETSDKEYSSNNLKCSFCRKEFSGKSGLRRHIRETHNEDYRYICTVCNKGFHRYWNAERHKRKHRKEFSRLKSNLGCQPWIDACYCPVCDHRFHSKKKLMSHILDHGISHFFEKRSYNQIITENNVLCLDSDENGILSETTDTLKVIEQFHIKPREFAAKADLQADGASLKNANNKDFDEDKLSCLTCIKKFKQKSGLRRHMREVHVQGNKYTCETCKKGFHRYWNYVRHERSHNKNEQNVGYETSSPSSPGKQTTRPQGPINTSVEEIVIGTYDSNSCGQPIKVEEEVSTYDMKFKTESQLTNQKEKIKNPSMSKKHENEDSSKNNLYVDDDIYLLSAAPSWEPDGILLENIRWDD